VGGLRPPIVHDGPQGPRLGSRPRPSAPLALVRPGNHQLEVHIGSHAKSMSGVVATYCGIRLFGLRAALEVLRDDLPIEAANGQSLVDGESNYACCGVVRNDCCWVSTPKVTAFEWSSAPLPSANPAIACTSWAA